MTEIASKLQLDGARIVVDAARAVAVMREVSEEILAELRDCPPTRGHAKVQVPGERERELRARAENQISIPERTWGEVLALGESLGG